MDTQITTFTSPVFGDIRTAGTPAEPLFCLADVCKALDINGGARNVKSRLKSRGVVSINTPTYNQHGALVMQEMNFIDEPNLYRCIFQSRKPEAETFQDWVTSEVLPSIRKTGGYVAAQEEDTPEMIMARALKVAQSTIERHQARIEQQQDTIHHQERELKQAAPKVTYYDQTLQSVNTMTTTQVAKSMGMDVRELTSCLKEAGLIYKQSGQWMLHAPYCRWGLHSTRTTTFTRSDGRTGTDLYTVWTERGRRFINAIRSNGWDIKAAEQELKTA